MAEYETGINMVFLNRCNEKDQFGQHTNNQMNNDDLCLRVYHIFSLWYGFKNVSTSELRALVDEQCVVGVEGEGGL